MVVESDAVDSKRIRPSSCRKPFRALFYSNVELTAAAINKVERYIQTNRFTIKKSLVMAGIEIYPLFRVFPLPFGFASTYSSHSLAFMVSLSAAS